MPHGGSSAAVGQPIITYQCEPSNTGQKWGLTPAGQVKLDGTSLCWVLTGAAAGATIRLASCNSADESQRFVFTRRPLGLAHLANGLVVGNVVTLRGGQEAIGTVLENSSLTGSLAQQLELLPTGEIKPMGGIGGWCVQSAGTGWPGYALTLSSCTGAPNQRWEWSNGSIVSYHGFCWTVLNGDTSAGAALGMANCNAADVAQKFSVTPVASVATVRASPSEATLAVGSTQLLVAALVDASGSLLGSRPVTWTSSDPGVATVSSDGLVTAVASGYATIGATREGKVGTAAIRVTASTPSALYPNEPAGFTPALELSIDVLPGSDTVSGTQYLRPGSTIPAGGATRWEIGYDANHFQIASDGTAPTGGTGKYLRYRIPMSLNDGDQAPNRVYAYFGREYKEVYYSVRFRIEGTTFENQSSGHKLLGYLTYGTYPPENTFYWLLIQHQGWACCEGSNTQTPYAGPFQLETRPGGSAGSGTDYIDNNQGTGLTIYPGRWHHFESYMKMNTQVNGVWQADGIYKQWIDGVLVQSKTTVKWIDGFTSQPFGWYQWHMDPIWGGNAGQIKQRDDWVDFDNVYISGIDK